jgi:hyperosmotically inducible protein
MRSRLAGWFAAVTIAALAAACSQNDAGITTSVKSKLAADDEVKAYQIDVDTNNKVVTLTGTVETGTAKARAVEIARGTDGVTSVIDNLQVGGATASQPDAPDAARAMYSDAALTTAVKGKLAAETALRALAINVDSRDGVVTLTGEVASRAEKDQALKIARDTEGVKSVTDNLTVRP